MSGGGAGDIGWYLGEFSFDLFVDVRGWPKYS